MIAITGATGCLGKATIGFLLEKVKAEEITAIIRDPTQINDFHACGVHVRVAGYDRMDELRVAFRGIDTLVQISATALGEAGIRQENNVVMAACREGVEHIFYTSTVTPRKDALFKATSQSLQTEKAIRASGMTYTFFRNSLYMEIIPQFIGSALHHSQICYPAGQGRISFVSRHDIAEALSTAACSSADHQNKCYEITGSHAVSFHDMAELLTDATGIPITYHDIDIITLRNELETMRLPLDQIDWVLNLSGSIKAGEFAHVDTALETLLRRKPLSLPEFFAARVNQLR